MFGFNLGLRGKAIWSLVPLQGHEGWMFFIGELSLGNPLITGHTMEIMAILGGYQGHTQLRLCLMLPYFKVHPWWKKSKSGISGAFVQETETQLSVFYFCLIYAKRLGTKLFKETFQMIGWKPEFNSPLLTVPVPNSVFQEMERGLDGEEWAV